MKKLFLIIVSTIILFAGCVGSDPSEKEKQYQRDIHGYIKILTGDDYYNLRVLVKKRINDGKYKWTGVNSDGSYHFENLDRGEYDIEIYYRDENNKEFLAKRTTIYIAYKDEVVKTDIVYCKSLLISLLSDFEGKFNDNSLDPDTFMTSKGNGIYEKIVEVKKGGDYSYAFSGREQGNAFVFFRDNWNGDISANNTLSCSSKHFDNRSYVIRLDTKKMKATFTLIPIVDKIEITAIPEKMVYNIGEALDSTGIEVTATYSDNSIKIESITAGAITGFDSSSEGTKILTVTIGKVTNTFKVMIKGSESETPNSMILVPAGKTSASNGSITIEKDFYIGKYEVTQLEFQSVMGFNPSYRTKNALDTPVESVTWYDAAAFCNKKSSIEGIEPYYNISEIIKTGKNITKATVTENIDSKGYRIPNEKEWEYAARGGKNGVGYKYSGSNNIEDVGWNFPYDDYNYEEQEVFDYLQKGPNSVGKKASNELGIYDMSGNVEEWCADIEDNHNSFGGWCGGYWSVRQEGCEVSSIYFLSSYQTSSNVGFRVCRSK